MFAFLKSDPLKKLDREYQAKLQEAMQMQRKGDIRRYSLLTEEAETIQRSIEALKAKS